MTTCANKKRYIALCNKADDILIKVGIRNTCILCSTKVSQRFVDKKGKPIPHAPFVGAFGTDRLGCCTGCNFLGAKGCTTKNLSCKLWLCNDYLSNKLRKSGYFEDWTKIKEEANANEWNTLFRSRDINYFFPKKQQVKG